MENRQKTEKKKPSSSAKRDLKPLKVVYISNPMKLKASVSNFRSLVQEFTGQNSVWPVDSSKFSSCNQTAPNNISTADADLSSANSSSNDTDTGKDNGTAEPSPDVSAASSDLYFQPLDQDADDDRVVLIDHHMLNYMLHDHQDFSGFAQSGDLGSSKKV